MKVSFFPYYSAEPETGGDISHFHSSRLPEAASVLVSASKNG